MIQNKLKRKQIIKNETKYSEAFMFFYKDV